MKRLITILLSLLIVLSMKAYDFQAGHLFYNVVDSAHQLVEVTYEYPYRVALYGRLRKVTIPPTVTYDSTTYTVVGIGATAFHDCPKLRRIRLPKTLLYIDSAALAELHSLDSIMLPEGLRRIGDAAFYHCKTLSSIHLPASVDSIGLNVFAYCHQLDRITVAPENPSYDSRQDCNGICRRDSDRLVATGPRTTFPDKLLGIGEQAFAYSPYIRQAILPDGLRHIDYAAFAGCDMLDTLRLPETLDSLGAWAFYGCKMLRHIHLPEALHSIPANCFAECNDLRELVLPASVDSLAERAFYFSGIRSAELKGVRYIGVECFAACRFLRTLTLSASLEEIAPYAFENCNALERIYIPLGTRKRFQKLLPKPYHKYLIER